MKNVKAKIIRNTKISDRFYRMEVSSGYLAAEATPGQFVEIRCSCGTKPLLRRPLGVHRISDNGIELLYELVGEGTRLLSQKTSGQTVDVLGPLGNGFDIKPDETAILVAGGIGTAPLVGLADNLPGAKKHVFIGARTRSHVLCEKEFKSSGCSVRISTDDGTKGMKGLVTDLLSDFLGSKGPEPMTIYACGPAPMLKTVARISSDRKIPCQVSLEERMACGVGVCLGCPVKLKSSQEYKMVCKDGPVFDAEDIAW